MKKLRLIIFFPALLFIFSGCASHIKNLKATSKEAIHSRSDKLEKSVDRKVFPGIPGEFRFWIIGIPAIFALLVLSRYSLFRGEKNVA